MSLSNLGKFFHLMDTSNISKYDTIHEDILWYLMRLTDVERITSIKSLEVFLERYFLISEIEVDTIALDFIDSGSLISGVVSSHPFNFTVKDLLNFIGFSISDFPYDIYGTDKSFIERYEFKPPNVKISEGYNGVDLSGDAYLFQSVGVYTLLEIDSLNLRFKTDIKSIHPNETIKIKEFVKYVISQVDESIFDKYIKNFGHLLTNFKPLFNPDLTVKFNLVKDLNRDILFQIYEEFIPADHFEKIKNQLLSTPEILETDITCKLINEHIKLAYGVKNGWVKLNYDIHLSHDTIDPYFQIDPDLLTGDDDEIYCTQVLYDDWGMEEWIDLLPVSKKI